MILGYRHHSKNHFKRIARKCLEKFAEVYNLGLKGDTATIIYMPMIPQAAKAVLTCARLELRILWFSEILHPRIGN